MSAATSRGTAIRSARARGRHGRRRARRSSPRVSSASRTGICSSVKRSSKLTVELDRDARLAAIEADRPADARMAEMGVEPGAHAQGTLLLDLPLGTVQPPLDRLFPAIGMEGPGVGGIASEVKADALRPSRLRSAKRIWLMPLGAEGDGDHVVGQGLCRGRHRPLPARARARRHRAHVNWRAACGSIPAGKRMRGIIWLDSGWICWKGTGVCRSRPRSSGRSSRRSRDRAPPRHNRQTGFHRY